MKPGDRVRKRGFEHLGTVTSNDRGWVRVDWDDGSRAGERPALCSEKELETVS